MRFYKFPNWLKRFYPIAIWDFFLTENKNTIYLTFDDGPTPEVTEWIIECLNYFQAKATFFCIGNNVKNYPSLYKKYIENGHSVGNHTMNHLNGAKVSSKKYLDDIKKAKTFIHSNLFRPPYGKCTPKQYRLISKLGFTTIFWSHLSYDFDKKLSPEERINQFKTKVKPGSIIVFHDSVKAFPQLKTELPIILEHFKSKRFQFEKISINTQSKQFSNYNVQKQGG
jgi:peptidoglycan/xylan/chitin deacetylase (PgdA/CDA1 family)